MFLIILLWIKWQLWASVGWNCADSCWTGAANQRLECWRFSWFLKEKCLACGWQLVEPYAGSLVLCCKWSLRYRAWASIRCRDYESPSLRSIRRTPSQLHPLQQIPTQHDMLLQHLVYKNELNREYVITLARNDETPWWWPEKIETCRSGFKCFKW